MKFSTSILNELKYYVYIYSHPVTGEIFYIGKGKGNRVFSHLREDSQNEKSKYLKQLKAQNLKPKIEILVHGLENEEIALRVESSVIDLIGIKNLTNKQSGYRSSTFGRMTIDQINSLYNKEKINIKDSVILIRINKAFRYSMSKEELYEYTRGRWKVKPNNANKAKYGLAIYNGIVQEVYEIFEWHKAGTTNSLRLKANENKLNTDKSLKGRYEFVGKIAPNKIRNLYRFKSVEHYFKQGSSNPIRYLNI